MEMKSLVVELKRRKDILTIELQTDKGDKHLMGRIDELDFLIDTLEKLIAFLKED